MCEKCKDEKFHARIVSDDETASVETEFTLGELEETLKIVTNAAIQDRDPASLKIASLFAFTAKRFEEVHKERAMFKARFESCREAIEEIQNLPDSEIKEAVSYLLEMDEMVGNIFEALGEIM